VGYEARIELRIDPELKRRWKLEAIRQGVSLTEWIVGRVERCPADTGPSEEREQGTGGASTAESTPEESLPDRAASQMTTAAPDSSDPSLEVDTSPGARPLAGTPQPDRHFPDEEEPPGPGSWVFSPAYGWVAAEPEALARPSEWSSQYGQMVERDLDGRVIPPE